MNFQHAVLWTDHQTAQFLQFDAEQVVAQKLRTHVHPTGQHGSSVRGEHEFFASLCDAMDGAAQTLVTGSRTTLADLRHYVEKHRPQTAARVAGYEVVDHPSDKQLVAQARKFFLAHDGAAGLATPG